MFLVSLVTLAAAQGFIRYDTSECIGIYGPNNLVGPESHLEVKIDPIVKQGSVAVAVFNFADRYSFQTMEYIGDFLLCSPTQVTAKICLESELGKFHVKNIDSKSSIMNELASWNITRNPAIEGGFGSVLDNSVKLKYNVTETGYYCIFMASNELEDLVDYNVDVVVSNPYGKLPAILFPALPFYATFSVLYTIIGVIWMTVSFLYWKVFKI